ncbi:SpoIIE family protein phosphatase, partial [Cellulomonas sp. P5_E12]
HVVRVVLRGSTLLLYTDGLVERRGEHLRVGLDRLVAQVADLTRDDGAGHAGRDLDGLVDELLRRLVPEGEADDDVAVLAVHLEPLRAARTARSLPEGQAPDPVTAGAGASEGLERTGPTDI